MNRTSFPAGQVSISFVKALLMHLDKEKSGADGDAFLRRCHITRDDLVDETRPMSLLAFHEALVVFVGMTSKEQIGGAWPYIIAPDNLGFWMRVLRGTHSPNDAFARLDANESEYGKTTRWQTLTSKAGHWRGRVFIAHDPRIEEDGLLAEMRMAQLSVVPALFGFGRARVRALGSRPGEMNELVQDFEVSWPTARVGAVAGWCSGAGAGVGSLAFLMTSDPAIQFVALAACALGGAMFGAAWAREGRRRIETFAQSTRVNALERNLALKEERERARSGHLEGSVVAGQYRIKQSMGAGASGVIYEAVRVRDALPVAIKLLRAAAAHDAVASDRLRREAEALGLAWHPNVVEMIDQGHLPDGTAYLVMELLRGESLATRIRNQGPLSPQLLLPIALQVCEALIAIHAAGVVHRDLKPSNIFLQNPKEVGAPSSGVTPPMGTHLPPGYPSVRVKVLDFGIARVEWEEMRITNIGSPLGTPGYMSPEQEAGGDIDARSDLFALGAVLYECLVGEPPPPTPSGLWLSEQSSTATGPRAERIQSALRRVAPRGWRKLIERALLPTPQDRFQDARTFAHALRELEADVSSAAPNRTNVV